MKNKSEKDKEEIDNIEKTLNEIFNICETPKDIRKKYYDIIKELKREYLK